VADNKKGLCTCFDQACPEKKIDPCGATSCVRIQHICYSITGAGPEYSTREEGEGHRTVAAFALTRCTMASDTVPNTTHRAVPDPPRHTTRREMRGPDSRDHEFRSPHRIFEGATAHMVGSLAISLRSEKRNKHERGPIYRPSMMVASRPILPATRYLIQYKLPGSSEYSINQDRHTTTSVDTRQPLKLLKNGAIQGVYFDLWLSYQKSNYIFVWFASFCLLLDNCCKLLLLALRF
jgi:hypothetical protein